MAKRIDVAALPLQSGTFYPPPYDEPCRARERRRLGDAAGLSQFGVNLLRLPPGAWSSQRHWHFKQDEFVYVLACAGFKAGDEDGHHLVNRSGQDVMLLEVGTRVEGDGAMYPGIDLVHPPNGQPAIYTHADGTPYDDIRRRTTDNP